MLNLDLNSLRTLSCLPKTLKKLSASGNQLQDCSGLGNMVLLEELDLSRNLIEVISGLGTPGLKVLNLSGNRVKILPGLDKCSHLETLNLSNNQLTKIKSFSPVN